MEKRTTRELNIDKVKKANYSTSDHMHWNLFEQIFFLFAHLHIILIEIPNQTTKILYIYIHKKMIKNWLKRKERETKEQHLIAKVQK